MQAVRPIQDEAVDLLKKTFEESGFVSGHQAFYLSLSNENGERRTVAEFSPNWDPIWKDLNEEFDKACDEVAEFHVLKDKMFWVFDGNHRWTAWTAVASMYPEKRRYHPCVKFTLLEPDQMSWTRVEQAMHKLNK